MFEKLTDNSNFTCIYEFRPNGRLFFGMKCATTVQIDKLLEREEGLISSPTRDKICESTCLDKKSHRPSYDEFSLISIKRLRSYCRGKEACRFSVLIEFDFKQLAWVRNNGSIIDDFVWASRAYPQYHDIERGWSRSNVLRLITSYFQPHSTRHVHRSPIRAK